MKWAALMFLGLVGCLPESTASDGPCDKICDILVQDCAYDAFPSLDSCWEGCAYQEEEFEDYDVDGHLECLETSNCDTFAILECSHAFEGTE